MEGLASIIAPIYNSSNYLIEMIESVMNQTYQNWELILIDDKSTDNSKEIIIRFSNNDNRIIPIFLEQNKGVGYARNIGLENSKGEFIAFLDSDDYWHPNKLQDQIEFIINTKIDIVSNYYFNVDENSVIKSYFVLPEKITYNLLKFNNYILTSTLLCKSESIKGLRFSVLRKRQDWIFFLDILKRGLCIHTIKKCLTYYRKSSDSLSFIILLLV